MKYLETFKVQVFKYLGNSIKCFFENKTEENPKVCPCLNDVTVKSKIKTSFSNFFNYLLSLFVTSISLSN